MSDREERRALEQLFVSVGREFEGKLLPMSVVFPGLAKRPAPAPGSGGELSPTAKVAL